MNDTEYLALKARADAGENLPVVDAFLFEQETAHRARKPNALEQLLAARRRNPLLDLPRNVAFGPRT